MFAAVDNTSMLAYAVPTFSAVQRTGETADGRTD
jgi:hypothetical protein